MSFRLPDAPGGENPARLYLDSLGSKKSRTGMINALNTLSILAGAEPVSAPAIRPGRARNVTWESFPWHELRPHHTDWFRKILDDRGYSPATKNRILAALAGVYLQLRRQGILTVEEYEDATDFQWYRIPRKPPPANKQPLSTEEFARMLAAARADHSDAHRVRNDAILWLLWGCGMRRAELVAVPNGRTLEGMTMAKYDPREHHLEVSLKRNTRYVPLEGDALEAFEKWLSIRGKRAGAILVRISKRGDLLLDQPLGDSSIHDVVKWRARKASPPVCDVTCHRFRHNFVTTLHSRGVAPGLLAKIVGHAQMATILNYINPTQQDIRLAVRRMPSPEVGRHAVSDSGPGPTDRGSDG